MTTASEMTIEHMGQDATQDDLDRFRELVAELMRSDGISEEDATAALWGDGDYMSNAVLMGLMAACRCCGYRDVPSLGWSDNLMLCPACDAGPHDCPATVAE